MSDESVTIQINENLKLNMSCNCLSLALHDSIASLCNGSISDFDSESRGSNPLGAV